MATELLNYFRNPVRTARLARSERAAVRPPGPKGKPFIGVLPQYQRDPFTYLRNCAADYGDVFSVPLPVLDIVCVNHPDHVAQIMADNTGTYSMVGPFESLAHNILGASIPYMEGAAFKRRRRLITPMFRNSSLAELSPAVVDEFNSRMDAWAPWVGTGKTVDLQHKIAWLTMPAFMRAMFGIPLTDGEIDQLDQDLRTILKMMSAAVLVNRPPNLLPFGRNNLWAAYRRTRRWINKQIEHRLAQPIEGTDLLQVLLDARDEDGNPLSRKDLIAELLILIAGGYETVVASTAWTLALLRDNPAARAQLQAEVDQLGGQTPTYADLERLTWVKACFDEGQRLQGHPFHPRIAMRDDTIDGYFIPKGTIVGVSVYALHRDQRWWDNPDQFDPSRFTDRDTVAARPSLAYIPFGAGPHRCIGSQMGYMNAMFILTLLHQRFELAIDPGWRPVHASTFSCTISGGLPVRLEPRRTTTIREALSVSS